MSHPMKRLSLLIVLTLLLALAGVAQAKEWTRFRGPGGSGVSNAKTIPVQFTQADHNWRVELAASGHSSPVIWDGKVFVSSADAENLQWRLECFRASDGRRLWKTSYDLTAYRLHRLNHFASATPAVDEQYVYATIPTPNDVTVLAIDHRGKFAWRRGLGPQLTNFGGASSPIVVGEVVIVVMDSEKDGPGCFIIGLNRKTGKTKWKLARTTGRATFSTPMVYEPQGAPPEVIITSTAHGLTSINPRTGKVNWEVANLSENRCVGSPVLANGNIIATSGSGGGGNRALAITPGGRGGKRAPKIVYEVNRGVSYVPTPIAYGKLLFFWGTNGLVTCVSAENGETFWSERTSGEFWGSPVIVDGKLYSLNVEGALVVVDAAKEFKILARNDLGEGSYSTPAIDNGVMYLRTATHLISVGGKK